MFTGSGPVTPDTHNVATRPRSRVERMHVSSEGEKVDLLVTLLKHTIASRVNSDSMEVMLTQPEMPVVPRECRLQCQENSPRVTFVRMWK